MFTYTQTLTHTFQSAGNLILISISVLCVHVCVCVASGGWLPVGNVIPEFPSGSICPAGDWEHIRTHKHAYILTYTADATLC